MMKENKYIFYVRSTPTEDGLMPRLPSRQKNVLRKPLPLTTTSHPWQRHHTKKQAPSSRA